MIVNIAAYHFVVIEDPAQLAQQLREQAKTLQLRGTALVAGEGINLFLAGSAEAIETLLDGVRADPRFAGLAVKYSYSQTQPFAKLKVKLKQEIIAFRREQASPLQERAPTVTPSTLERWLDRGVDDDGRRVVLLDTRNREEVDYGSFDNALTLPIDNFTELPEALAPHREDLRDATVVSFCTGGIRCEKAALWLRADGMDNLLQLDGGILGYFEKVGGKHYQGRCFVFDERVALDPQLRPLRDEAA